MPNFALPSISFIKKTIPVKRSSIALACRFRLPEGIKEQMSATESTVIEADVLMNFYVTPSAGALIEYNDTLWKVISVTHYPTKRYSKEPKTIPLVRFEYLGSPDYSDEFEA